MAAGAGQNTRTRAIGWRGKYRVYFNRHNEYPYVWSVDQGTQETEVAITSVELFDSDLKTEYLKAPESKSKSDYHAPSAVLSGRGVVRIFLNGSCKIWPINYDILNPKRRK